MFCLSMGAVGVLVARDHESALAVAGKTVDVYSIRTPVQLD